MPSPRKRALRAAVGNILVPVDATAPTLTQIAYTDAWWNTVITEHANNYASNDKPFENGEAVLIGASNSDYDGLIADGESGAVAALSAIATLTFTGTQTTNRVIDITGSAGLAKRYTSKTAETLASNQFKGNGTAAANAQSLLDCIAHADGHNGAIVGSRTGDVLTLKQAVGGAAGNTTFDLNTLDNVTSVSFQGGADAGASVPHYWFDKTNTSTSATTATDSLALTTATGVIYDPSGPHSQYIPLMETVSEGTARYICVKPTGWSANDYISWELIGDTEGTNDKLSLEVADADDNKEAVKGVTAAGAEEAVTTKSGTIAYEGKITFEADVNDKGILLQWDADGTGTNSASVKKGWYFRWSYTAV